MLAAMDSCLVLFVIYQHGIANKSAKVPREDTKNAEGFVLSGLID